MLFVGKKHPNKSLKNVIIIIENRGERTMENSVLKGE